MELLFQDTVTEGGLLHEGKLDAAPDSLSGPYHAEAACSRPEAVHSDLSCAACEADEGGDFAAGENLAEPWLGLSMGGEQRPPEAVYSGVLTRWREGALRAAQGKRDWGTARADTLQAILADTRSPGFDGRAFARENGLDFTRATGGNPSIPYVKAAFAPIDKKLASKWAAAAEGAAIIGCGVGAVASTLLREGIENCVKAWRTRDGRAPGFRVTGAARTIVRGEPAVTFVNGVATAWAIQRDGRWEFAQAGEEAVAQAAQVHTPAADDVPSDGDSLSRQSSESTLEGWDTPGLADRHNGSAGNEPLAGKGVQPPA